MEYFYTCNQCGRVLVNDRFHLIGSEDYDLCHYDYSQLNEQNKALFAYTQNEHMGGPSGMGGSSPAVADTTNTHDAATQCEVPMGPATPEEDYQQAMTGFDSDDERSIDSMSTGSLNDFLDFNSQPMEEEQVEEIQVIEFEEFFADMPCEAVSMVPKLCITRMENEHGESESDWSETEDEDESHVEQMLCPTARDRAEEHMAAVSTEIIRVPNRAFGKRVIKPRLGNLFTYPVNWIKNGGEGEF